jgi:hypothetical protein
LQSHQRAKYLEPNSRNQGTGFFVTRSALHQLRPGRRLIVVLCGSECNTSILMLSRRMLCSQLARPNRLRPRRSKPALLFHVSRSDNVIAACAPCHVTARSRKSRDFPYHGPLPSTPRCSAWPLAAYTKADYVQTRPRARYHPDRSDPVERDNLLLGPVLESSLMPTRADYVQKRSKSWEVARPPPSCGL